MIDALKLQLGNALLRFLHTASSADLTKETYCPCRREFEHGDLSNSLLQGQYVSFVKLVLHMNVQ